MRKIVVIALGALSLCACLDETYVKEDRTDKRVKTLKLSHRVGGTQDCVLVHDGIWYLGFGQELQVLEGRGKKPLRSDLTFSPLGTSILTSTPMTAMEVPSSTRSKSFRPVYPV